MSVAGNDFVVLETGAASGALRKLAKQVCDRKFGIGADGLLIMQKSRRADMKMRIFNADGSEAEMCGNGAQCAAYYGSRLKAQGPRIRIETKAGIIDSAVSGKEVKIRLTDPEEMRLNFLIGVNGVSSGFSCGAKSRPPALAPGARPERRDKRRLKVHYIDTGVPHVVIFVEGLENIDLLCLGKAVRYHQAFAPRGANVDIVEVVRDNYIKIRTYERGVEGETLACGTGAAASALITASLLPCNDRRINVQTSSGDILNVYFSREGDRFKDVWLAGQARIIYRGTYYV